VLFIPVGNVFTLDIRTAVELVKAVAPKVVIPMHYRIGGLSLSIRPVDDFLKAFPSDRIVRVGNEVEIKPEDLPEETEIWVFSL
jgi:L-ascorbate metabolism protein UlaG (beta-lactamase superfamily)